jgi:hypothetical protein
LPPGAMSERMVGPPFTRPCEREVLAAVDIVGRAGEGIVGGAVVLEP